MKREYTTDLIKLWLHPREELSRQKTLQSTNGRKSGIAKLNLRIFQAVSVNSIRSLKATDRKSIIIQNLFPIFKEWSVYCLDKIRYKVLFINLKDTRLLICKVFSENHLVNFLKAVILYCSSLCEIHGKITHSCSMGWWKVKQNCN